MTDDETANEFAQALMEGISAMSPLFDAAEGMRADLERRGWSPTLAEATAHQWLLYMMAKIWGNT